MMIFACGVCGQTFLILSDFMSTYGSIMRPLYSTVVYAEDLSADSLLEHIETVHADVWARARREACARQVMIRRARGKCFFVCLC